MYPLSPSFPYTAIVVTGGRVSTMVLASAAFLLASVTLSPSVPWVKNSYRPSPGELNMMGLEPNLPSGLPVYRTQSPVPLTYSTA